MQIEFEGNKEIKRNEDKKKKKNIVFEYSFNIIPFSRSFKISNRKL